MVRVKKQRRVMSSGSNRKKKNDASDEVEQLLQAAQDEMLLKISVDSHMSRVCPDYIDSDLDRRFQALKSRQSHVPKSSSSSEPRRHHDVHAADEVKGVTEDDNLSARFAALRASLPVPSSSSSFSNDNDLRISSGKSEGLDRDDEEDEVEKVIQWAKDAARLDPSSPSDDDDEGHDVDDSDSDDDSRKKGRRK